ncbi:hypothetical protein KEM56_002828 [Ascosphaera pollenicola]|nr:hypothetical protein KEM56_002828 [Ascosphaera pollenicola]
MPSSVRTASAPIIVNKPVLHIEVRIKNDADDGAIIRTDLVRDEVIQWLVDNFAVLNLGQEIISFGSHAHCLESVKVIECTGVGTATPDSGPDNITAPNCSALNSSTRAAYCIDEVELDVHAYQLHSHAAVGLMGNRASASSNGVVQEKNGFPTGSDGLDDAIPEARVVELPCKEFDGIWESLMFDTPVASNLLRALSRMVLFSWKRLDTWTINWNRIALLYGPPGTGKTSLCRALAQKLSIRLSKCFPSSKLIEVSAPSLGSKFFSESSKLVSGLFDGIEGLSDEEPDTFIAVFIDEVESLTAKREESLSGNDPFDAMRAVNALLTGLDRIRRHNNVIVLCTSNLITALDSAFFDRIDIKQYIPHPSASIIYEIYRSCLISLNACSLIGGSTFDVIHSDATLSDSPLKYVACPAQALLLPTWTDMVVWYQIFPESVPKRLADIARNSEGLSGRTLRRLPALALVLYTNQSTCSIEQAIGALEEAVREENKAKCEAERPRR